jgi:VWFA-related protein
VASSQTALTVVLLDALNTPIADQAYARHEMLQYLKTQHSGQSTAIYALTNRLLLLQDFTNDPELLRTAIEKKLPQQSHLLTDPDQQMAIPGASADLIASIDSFEQDQINFQNQVRIQITLDSMTAIARSLSGYPGRKNLVWVSAAFPLSAAFDGDSSAFFNQSWMTNEVQRTATLLTNAQVSVYPVDARGLVGSPLASAQFTGRTRGGRLMNGQQLGNELNKRSFELSSSHDAMNQIADATGGKAYYNRNDIDHAVALSIADGSTYYTIAYYPANKDWNGKFRKVDIKLDRPGTLVRYRHGYYATDPMESAHLSKQAIQKEIGEALGNPLQSTMITVYGTAFKIVPAGKAQETAQSAVATSPVPQNAEKSPRPQLVERQKIGVRFLLDSGGITLEKRADGQHMSLDFAVAAFRGDKVVSQILKTVEGTPKADTVSKMMQQGLFFNTSLDVPKGNCRLRLLVHDNLNGKMGTVDIPITDATPTVQE